MLYDGAMGTYYHQRYPEETVLPEEANLRYPERIAEIHREYISAGAKKLKTNTFACLPSASGLDLDFCLNSIKAAWDLAHKAIEASNKASITLVADIGPSTLGMTHSSILQARQEYLAVVREFLALGATEFLFETQDSLEALLPTLEYIHKTTGTSRVTVSFSANPAGFTQSGARLESLLAEAEKLDSIDLTGINCELGPTHLTQLYLEFAHFPKLRYLSPNAGLPDREIGRERTIKDALYFAKALQPAWDKGAEELSGCCGTNPEDIRALANLYSAATPGTKPAQVDQPKRPLSDGPGDWFLRLSRGEKIIAVVFVSPVHERVDSYLRGIRKIRDAGCDLITIADNPVGRARIDSSLMAIRIQDTFAIPTMPHLTCRDRNLNASHGLLLGLAASGVHQVLIVTGDPLSLEARQQIKGVYNTDSVRFLRYVKEMNEDLTQAFVMAAAFNVNANNFANELRKAKRKVEAGARLFLTQPIYTSRAIEHLVQAKADLGENVYFLAGIMPIVSYKNGIFMKHELSGMDIPDELIERYAGLDREAGEQLAAEISFELMNAVRDIADGIYLMTPFQRSNLTAELCRRWKSMASTERNSERANSTESHM